MNTVSHNKTSVSTMKKIRFLDQQESIRGKLNFSDESQDGREMNYGNGNQFLCFRR